MAAVEHRHRLRAGVTQLREQLVHLQHQRRGETGRRDRAMQALGNRRTYAQISSWATEVSRACNHRR